MVVVRFVAMSSPVPNGGASVRSWKGICITRVFQHPVTHTQMGPGVLFDSKVRAKPVCSVNHQQLLILVPVTSERNQLHI